MSIASIPERSAEPRTLRVALAGCGVVGSALLRQLHQSADAIHAQHGLKVEIVRVLVRDASRERNVPLCSSRFTADLDAFISEDADVVIEALGGRAPAGEIARAALRGGRRFVSANKELVASAGSELAALARASGGTLDFGAAVGGGAPAISTLRDLLGTTPPRSLRAILNGTSNYVLTRLERGATLDAALADARCRGLAESDCDRDLDGRDAAAKLAIIAWVCFGFDPALLPVRRQGLLPDPARFVRHASALGGRARLFAECATVAGERIVAAVEPVILDADSPFGRTELEENRVEVDFGWAAPIGISGPGAGGDPTATALLSDLFSSAGFPSGREKTPSVAAVHDPRAHSWLVAARISPARLAAACSVAHVPAEDFGRDGEDSRVLIPSVTWRSLEFLLRELEARGANPIVARSELSRARGPVS